MSRASEVIEEDDSFERISLPADNVNTQTLTNLNNELMSTRRLIEELGREHEEKWRQRRKARNLFLAAPTCVLVLCALSSSSAPLPSPPLSSPTDPAALPQQCRTECMPVIREVVGEQPGFEFENLVVTKNTAHASQELVVGDKILEAGRRYRPGTILVKADADLHALIARDKCYIETNHVIAYLLKVTNDNARTSVVREAEQKAKELTEILEENNKRIQRKNEEKMLDLKQRSNRSAEHSIENMESLEAQASRHRNELAGKDAELSRMSSANKDLTKTAERLNANIKKNAEELAALEAEIRRTREEQKQILAIFAIVFIIVCPYAYIIKIHWSVSESDDDINKSQIKDEAEMNDIAQERKELVELELQARQPR